MPLFACLAPSTKESQSPGTADASSWKPRGKDGVLGTPAPHLDAKQAAPAGSMAHVATSLQLEQPSQGILQPQQPEQPAPVTVELTTAFKAPQPANVLPEQLAQLLLNHGLTPTRTSDVWAHLQRCMDSICAALPATAASLYLLSTSRMHCKIVCNALSPQQAVLRKLGWELVHTAGLPAVMQVASSASPSYHQVETNAAPGSSKVPADFQVLYTQAMCTSFLCVPIFHGHTVIGALALGHSEPLSNLIEHRWLAVLLPMLSVYLHEASAVKLCNTVERIQKSHALSHLAWLVTSKLDCWFEWCHPEDTEARIVLLSPDQQTAMVMSRSMGPTRAYDPLSSIDMLIGGVPLAMHNHTDYLNWRGHAGSADELGAAKRDTLHRNALSASASVYRQPGGLEESLLGTQMSLQNTLTRRCLAEGSKLLFVADVMAALKKYGEPWKDVFMEQAIVTNPCWVVAAPIVLDGQHLGAILWLSSTRLNPNMLAQAAKASIPPLLHAIAKQIQHFGRQQAPQQQPVAANAAIWSQVLSMPHLNFLGTSNTSTSGHNISNYMHLDTGNRGLEESRALRYTMVSSETASTSALMHAYQTAIMQHQRSASPGGDVTVSHEEIQVLAKAGQGAFGSVYVALWKGLVVAVKVMRQQLDGRRAMRTAWELAVTKTVSHPNIVTVHATFTDMVVVKLSKRIIRFVPAATTLSQASSLQAAGGPSTAGPNGSGDASPGRGTSSSSWQGGPPRQDNNTRCQVIIMEYCNLGPLHHYIAERKHARSMTGSGTQEQAAAGDVTASRSAEDANLGSSATSAQSSQPTTSQTNSLLASSSMLAGSAAVDLPTTLATLVEVASSVMYLHSLGFVHCDLKPENILLKAQANQGDPRGFTAKVSDFGLSEMFTLDGPIMGELGGTVTHIAPEIVTHKRVTKACDAYAFGIVMWELYTGQRPYSDMFNNARDKRMRDKLILSKVAHENLRPTFPETCPYEFAHLARRCWAANSSIRPLFGEIVSELDAIQHKYCRPRPHEFGLVASHSSSARASVQGQQAQQDNADPGAGASGDSSQAKSAREGAAGCASAAAANGQPAYPYSGSSALPSGGVAHLQGPKNYLACGIGQASQGQQMRGYHFPPGYAPIQVTIAAPTEEAASSVQGQQKAAGEGPQGVATEQASPVGPGSGRAQGQASGRVGIGSAGSMPTGSITAAQAILGVHSEQHSSDSIETGSPGRSPLGRAVLRAVQEAFADAPNLPTALAKQQGSESATQQAVSENTGSSDKGQAQLLQQHDAQLVLQGTLAASLPASGLADSSAACTAATQALQSTVVQGHQLCLPSHA